ncbi:MAG: hypothetical protein U0694_10515 [Anaerolineae bacterium]
MARFLKAHSTVRLRNGQPLLRICGAKGYNVTPLEGKDVPYDILCVRQNSAQTVCMQHLCLKQMSYANSHRAIEQAFADGAGTVWGDFYPTVWSENFKDLAAP